MSMRATAWTITVLTIVAVLVVSLTVETTTKVGGSPRAIGTSDGDKKLVTAYFTELNSAAKDGPTTQRDFLRRTQHPDFTDRLCELGDLTLTIDPAMSTFRLDAAWTPENSTKHPRGMVYVLGVSISIRRSGALLGEQIGSQRVVVLDGKAYGFTPCPTE
jgi:hypothetical protein